MTEDLSEQDKDKAEQDKALRTWEVGAADGFAKSLMATPDVRGFTYERNNVPEVVIRLVGSSKAIRIRFVADLVDSDYTPE